MFETNGNRDKELNRFEVLFEKLCDLNCINQSKWQYREFMTIAMVVYKQEHQSNSKHEVTNAWALFCCIRFGCGESSARCAKVFGTTPVVSFYVSFGRETCTNKRNHWSLCSRFRVKTTCNLQHASDVLQVSMYGPNVYPDVMKINEEGKLHPNDTFEEVARVFARYVKSKRVGDQRAQG